MDSPHNTTSEYENSSHWYIHECTLHLDFSSRRVMLFLLHLLFFMVGLVENCLVVWVNWKRRKTCSRVLFCVLNVSLSDLMMVLVIPFFMLEVTIDNVWLWGHFLCKFTNLVYTVNLYSSSFFVACMTMERYLSVCRPEPSSWGPPERHRRALICGGLWTLAFLLALLENVHVDLMDFREPGCFMFPEHNFEEWFNAIGILNFFLQFLGPAAIIITCNVLIARAMEAVPDVEGRRDVWLVHIYSLVFVVCWLPYHLVNLLIMVDSLSPYLFSCNTIDAIFFSYSIVQGFSLLHCIANPILYNFLSKGFQDVLVNSLLQHLSRKEPDAQPQANSGGGEVVAGDKGRRASSSSTSHSAIGP